MAELKEGTLKITVTEAALKMLGEQSEAFHQRGGYLGGVTGSDQLRPEYLAQCDKCLAFCAREEVGYRDESRTDGRDCHEHDWRCDEDLGEDSCPHEHQSVPEWEEVHVSRHANHLKPRYGHRTNYCRCGARRFSNAFHTWPWETPAEPITPINDVVLNFYGDCPKCGRVMAIPVGGGFECRFHDCRRSS